MLLKLLITVGVLWSRIHCDTTERELNDDTAITIFEDDNDKLSETTTLIVTTLNETIESHVLDNYNTTVPTAPFASDDELSVSNEELDIGLSTNSSSPNKVNVTSVKSVQIETPSNLTKVLESNSTTTSTTSSTTTSTSTTSTTTTTTSPATTVATIPSEKPTLGPSINFTTTETPKNSTDEKPLLKSFNLNYLYFLLLIIPLVAVFIGVYCYCKRRKKSGYTEPIAKPNNRTRRFSTPSWVFSEPDFVDEEVITLQEEKK